MVPGVPADYPDVIGHVQCRLKKPLALLSSAPHLYHSEEQTSTLTSFYQSKWCHLLSLLCSVLCDTGQYKRSFLDLKSMLAARVLIYCTHVFHFIIAAVTQY